MLAVEGNNRSLKKRSDADLKLSKRSVLAKNLNRALKEIGLKEDGHTLQAAFAVQMCNKKTEGCGALYTNVLSKEHALLRLSLSLCTCSQ